MPIQDYTHTPQIIEITHDEDESWVINSITNAISEPLPSSTAKIHKVPKMVKEKQDYYKYYVPNVVSIGPYHFGNRKFECVEKLKPIFTMKLLNNQETLRVLYRKLSEPTMIQVLKSFYEEIDFSTMFCNKVFTKMMLLDSCFILYYIHYIFFQNLESYDQEYLKSNQIAFIYQDLFLLENQIPFVVLNEVMKSIDHIDFKIEPFLYDNVILTSSRPKTSWFKAMFCVQKYHDQEEDLQDLNNDVPDHLIGLLHRTLTRKVTPRCSSQMINHKFTYRNVSELMNLGIKFKPSGTLSLAHIEFCKSKSWWFSATVNLPPITVNDSTKAVLLNLIAYEMCSLDHVATDAWVTSYVCFMDTLIDRAEDVTSLRKARLLENCLGSDKEVATLFNEIGTDLVPNNLAHMEAKNGIQMHYESHVNKYYWQLKHQYFKSPWSFFAFVGALMVIGLNIVQTCFTISSKRPCDDLCMMLKKNHHL